MKLLVLANLAATLFMVGAIFVVQIVHYPLFDRVGTEGYTRYQAAHLDLITLVVMPPMLIEMVTAFILAFETPEGVSPIEMWIGLALVGVVWFATAFFSVPQHNVLASGFNRAAYEALVSTNWIRTLAWTARGALMLWVTARLMR
jgi:uncharacterized membrane protein